MASFMDQFAHPSGWQGSLVGWIMAMKNQERNRWTLQLLQLHPTDHLLEIGFGPGWAVAEAAKQLPKGQVMGVDPSATMLRDASTRNAGAIKAGRVGLRLGNEAPLPFPEAAFNKVMAVNSFQFWAKPMDGLCQVKRVLKTGGRAAITVQPMWVKSDDEARDVGEDLQKQMTEAGFREVTLEILPLKPLCFCALGLK